MSNVSLVSLRLKGLEMAPEKNQENIGKANLQLKIFFVLEKKIGRYGVQAYDKLYAFGKYSSLS